MLRAAWTWGLALLAGIAGAQATYRVEELRRLALSPQIDGVMQPEEWEPLSTDGGLPAFFQWEPGKLHWAGTAPAGKAITLSLDLSGDGWLRGRDNLEIRVLIKEEGPTFTVRLLDASTPAYAWINGSVPPGAIRFEVRPSGDQWTLEATLEAGPEIAKEGRTVGVRVETEDGASDPRTGTEMRLLANVSLNFDSHKLLPPGITWRPVIANRTIAVADPLRLSYTLQRQFDGPKPIKYEFRAEGLAAEDMGTIQQPLAAFDDRNQNRFEVMSPIRPEARPGWRIVRAKLYDATGNAFVLRSSVRIAPLLDLSANAPTMVRPGSRWRGRISLQSNSLNRLEGMVRIDAPTGWTVHGGQDATFRIGGARGRAETRFDIEIPPTAMGEYYIIVTAVVGDREVRQPIAVLVESEE